MSDANGRAIERLWRRVATMVSVGRITTTDDAGGVHKVQVRLGADELRDNTPVLTIYGLHSHAPAGSDATLLFVGGDRSNGLAIATGNQAARPRSTQPGEIGIYDDQGQAVFLSRSGIRISGAGKPVTITGTPKLRLECDLEVTGEVKAMCDGASVTLSQHRGHSGSGGPPTPGT